MREATPVQQDCFCTPLEMPKGNKPSTSESSTGKTGVYNWLMTWVSPLADRCPRNHMFIALQGEAVASSEKTRNQTSWS